MSRPALRRLLATPVAALLLLGGAVPLVAAPAAAAQGPVSPFNLDSSSGVKPLTYTADTAVFPPGPGQVTFRVSRTADPSDVLTTSGQSSSPATPAPPAPSRTVTQSVDTTRANPGLYNVQVLSNTPQATVLASCTECLLVGQFDFDCVSASRSGGVVTIRGGTFPKTTTLGFLAPGVAPPGTRAQDDAAITAVYDEDELGPLDTATLIPYVVDAGAAALAGTHRLVVRTTDGKSAVCPQLFTVPKGSLTADPVPTRVPAHLGVGASSARFTATGQGFLPGSTVTVALAPGAGLTDTNGVSATPTAVDANGLKLTMSATSGATTSARRVTYNAPDLGFYVDKTGLLVQNPPGVDNDARQGATAPSPATIGQGATDVPVTINVPNPANNPNATRSFSYDGAGLVASLGEVPGLTVRFGTFLSGGNPVTANPNARYTAARLLVSTVSKDAAGAKTRPPAGRYSLSTRNADGGQSPTASPDSTASDGSCYLCFAVAAGPVITNVSPGVLTPGGGPTTVTITGTGFKPVPFLTGPAASVIVLPDLNGDGNSNEWGVTYNSRSATTINVSITPPVGVTDRAFTLGVRNPTDQGFDDCASCLTIGGLSVNPPSPAFARNDGTYPVEVTGGPFSVDPAKTEIFLERNGLATLRGTITTLESGRIVATFPFRFASPAADYSVRVVSDGLVGRRQNSFEVRGLRPQLGTIDPSSGAPGAVLDVAVTGDNFAEGSTLVFDDPTQAAVDPLVTASPNTDPITDRRAMRVQVRVSPDAVPGTLYDVYVRNTDGQLSNMNQTGAAGTQFLVTPGAAATTFSPMTRDAGAPVFTGTLNGTGFAGATAMTFSGGGVSATDVVTAANGNSVTAKITIDPTASLDARDVTVTNGDGQKITCADCFTVTAPPVVKSISPAFVRTDKDAAVSQAFTVSGTGFGNGDVVSLGAGITVNSVAYSSTTGQLTVQATVAAGAARGLRTVSVTNSDANGAGKGTCEGCLTVGALPGPPVNLTAQPGDTTARLMWSPPTDDGGIAISRYTVEVVNSDSKPNGTVTVTGTTATVTGLTNGTLYGFSVKAVNELGSSTPAGTTATPGKVPAAPTGVTAQPGNGEASVSWTAPDNGGSQITKYTITAAPGGATKVVTGTPAATSGTVTGLTNGTAYTFTVVATNAIGDGPASAASAAVTPTDGRPAAPTAVVATVDRAPGTADLSWTAPAGTITSYRVEVTPAAGTVTYPANRAATTAVVTGLANGTAYTFRVFATTAGGEGAGSTATAPVTPYDVPGAPTALAGSGDGGNLTVTWTAPAANGRPITSYTLVLTPAEGTITYPTDRSQTGATVTGLTAGKDYAASVVATNARGTGAAGTATLRSNVTTSQGRFVGLPTPVRALDSRPSSNVGTSPGAKRGPVTLDLSSRIPATATGAVLNVTVTAPDRGGFVVVYPFGAAKPPTSNVNFAAGQTQANEVVTALTDRKATVFVDTTGSTQLIVDVVGYFTSETGNPGYLVPTTPKRVLGEALARNVGSSTGSSSVDVDLTSALPAGATGAVLNVTVASPTDSGFVVAYPAGTTQPGTSNVNFGANQVQANEVVTLLGTGNKVRLTLSRGQARLIVDVVGAIVPSTATGAKRFTALPAPVRALDTRDGTGTTGTARRSASSPVELTLPSAVPADATGVILNVTSTSQVRSGYVVVFPTGTTMPGTSNVNFRQGVNQANEVLVGIGTGRKVTLAVGGGADPETHVIADVVGYLR